MNSISQQVKMTHEQNRCGCVLCQLCNKLYWKREDFVCNKYMLQAIKPQSENLHWYLEQVIRHLESRKPVHLVIMGRDPYPQNPIGFPFAKNDMSSQHICDSGYVLLWALGIQHFPTKSHTVKRMYKELLKNGIILLNVCYKFMGECFSKSNAIHHLKCANSFNKYVLDYAKSNNGIILFCGESTAQGICWANNEQFHKKEKVSISLYRNCAIQICHPSGTDDSTWKKIWGKKQGCLLDVIEDASKRNNIVKAVFSINKKLPANICPIPPQKI